MLTNPRHKMPTVPPELAALCSAAEDALRGPPLKDSLPQTAENARGALNTGAPAR